MSASTAHNHAPEQGRRRIYYGWIMAPIAMVALVASSPGQTFGLGIFNDALRQDLGLSLSQITGAYMLGTLLAAVPMSYIGALMDRHGLRKVLTAASILFGFACIAAGAVQGLATLFVAFFLLRLLGQGALGMLSGNILAFWFHKRLGLVEGLRHFGMAGAIAVIPMVNLWLIQGVGWRWAFAVLGVGVMALMLPLMLLFRNRPEDVGQHIDGESPHAQHGGGDGAAGLEYSFTLAEAARTRALWIAAGSLALWGMMGTALQFNVVPLFESRGLDATAAAAFFPVFAISLAAMQVIGGVLADRLPAPALISMAMTAVTGAMLLLWGAATPWMGPAVGVLCGIGQGLLTTVLSPLWPRYFGRGHIGRIRGALATAMVASTSVGPFLVGLFYDLLGGYDLILLVFALLPIPFIVLAFWATPPTPPRAQDMEPARQAGA